ncbi:MAG TPA: 6-phosphogluconolactonase [Armatimonadota bacterium]|jgi:6-phosphogluconolactonase
MPRVEVFADLDAVSRAGAALFRDEATTSTGPVHIALSGGSTPRRMLELLATPSYSDVIPWDRVNIWQVDERPVPLDHPDSNAGMILAALTSRVPLAEGAVHFVPTDGRSPAEAAADYDALLRRHFDTLPAFHLIFLGLGEDGHTASLFPYSLALAERERWATANPVAKLGIERITLTYPVLNAARQVAFMVSGSEKAPALEAVLYEPRDAERWPAQGVEPAGGSPIWLVDAAARPATPSGAGMPPPPG